MYTNQFLSYEENIGFSETFQNIISWENKNQTYKYENCQENTAKLSY